MLKDFIILNVLKKNKYFVIKRKQHIKLTNQMLNQFVKQKYSIIR